MPNQHTTNPKINNFNLDNLTPTKIIDVLSSSKNYDEDTKRWLLNTELHPIDRFNEVSLWGNPQFNFYGFHQQTNTQNDPYSFLDAKHIDNATPIKLHEHSPILGPNRLNQPQIQVQISDLQETIDSAIGTVIDEQYKYDEHDDDSFDHLVEQQQLNKDRSKSVESYISESNKNNNNNNDALPLTIHDEYAIDQQQDDEQETDSDDFQMID